MTVPLALPLWPVECSTILLSRCVCGDEATVDLGDRFLSRDRQQAIAERHSSQVASMMETKTE